MRTLLYMFVCVMCGCTGAQDEPHLNPVDSKRTITIGEFEVLGNAIIIADPSYDRETIKDGFGVIMANCEVGDWTAVVIEKTLREPKYSVVGELVCHSSKVGLGDLTWIPAEGVLGVDAGMLGVFDEKGFGDAGRVPENTNWSFGDKQDEPAIPEDLWYSYCCEVVLENPEGGLVDGGAVTTSGFGDGAYGYSIAKNEDGMVIGVRIEFVTDEGEG